MWRQETLEYMTEALQDDCATEDFPSLVHEKVHLTRQKQKLGERLFCGVRYWTPIRHNLEDCRSLHPGLCLFARVCSAPPTRRPHCTDPIWGWGFSVWLTTNMCSSVVLHPRKQDAYSHVYPLLTNLKPEIWHLLAWNSFVAAKSHLQALKATDSEIAP